MKWKKYLHRTAWIEVAGSHHGQPFNRQPHKIVRHIKQFVWSIKLSNTRKLPTNCLSVFDHFVGLALKGLNFHKGRRNWGFGYWRYGRYWRRSDVKTHCSWAGKNMLIGLVYVPYVVELPLKRKLSNYLQFCNNLPVEFTVSLKSSLATF